MRASAWVRWYWLWDIYLAATYVTVTLMVLLRDDDSVPNRVGSAGMLTVMVCMYVVYGRRHITDTRELGCVPGRVFAGGLVLLQFAASVFDMEASFALFAVCPLMFMSLTLREAVVVVIGLNFVPPLAMVVRDGLGAALGIVGPNMVFTVLLGVTIGTWINRIVSESQERAELITELEQSREEVARLSREAGVAAERARLAAEIHDTLAQGFTSLVTLVQAAESELDGDTAKARKHLTLAARTARDNLTEARALVAGLTPTALGTGSLDQAIHRQLERFAEECPVSVTYHSDRDSETLPTVLEVVLLRLVQESLTNVRRHSRASEVAISLRVNENCAAMSVRDNGVGFDVAAPSAGFGLRGMRNRAAQVGGLLSVHSGAHGTTVELEVPR